MRRTTPAASSAAGALLSGTTAGQPAARAASSLSGATRTAPAPESRIAWPSCAGEKNSGSVTMVRPAQASARCQTMPRRSFGATSATRSGREKAQPAVRLTASRSSP